MERPSQLTPLEAYEAIQRLLERRDSISLAPHARKRMRERRFNMDDVRRVLFYGTVSANPVWDDSYQNWRYRVAYVDYDDQPLALIVALEPALGRITVITGTDD
jgi:Domain of unknown function (DUF4258)